MVVGEVEEVRRGVSEHKYDNDIGDIPLLWHTRQYTQAISDVITHRTSLVSFTHSNMVNYMVICRRATLFSEYNSAQWLSNWKTS